MADSTAPAPPQQLSRKHLLGIRGLTRADLELLFTTAGRFRQQLDQPIRKAPALRDVTIANLFFENSTRTRLSFELAAKRLSADVINFSASTSSVSKGETLRDTVNNILAMKVDLVIMRHPHPGAPHQLAQQIDATVVNAGDGAHEHPTQALLDAFSLQQAMGKDLQDVRVAIVGDILHSRVALSNVLCLKLLGAEVAVCAPPTLLPTHILDLGVQVFNRLEEAVQWSDALNMLRIQQERLTSQRFPSIRDYTRHYSLTRARLEAAPKRLHILHPGPMNRGVEISSEVADSDQAIILDQVTNGVAIRMAVLYLLAGGVKPIG